MEVTEKKPDGVFPSDGVITLDRIAPPGTCRVVMVPARGPIRQRLLAFGFVPGAVVKAVRTAPLGDPIEYKVKGCNISLRKEDARLISVTCGGA
jgi:ferrous iron transport protein A